MTITDPKIKTAAGKPPFDIVPWRVWDLILPEVQRAPEAYQVAEGLAWALRFGELKYAEYSYAHAELNEATFRRYIGAYKRHYTRAQTEDLRGLDADSGLPHLIHAFANLVILSSILLSASGDRGTRIDRYAHPLLQDYFGRWLPHADPFGKGLSITASRTLRLASELCFLDGSTSLCGISSCTPNWVRTPAWATADAPNSGTWRRV